MSGYAWTGQQIEHLLAYKMILEMAVQSAHPYRENSYPFLSRQVTWIKIKREGVKSGRSSSLKTDKLGLNCKTNRRIDAGTWDLGVLISHETSSTKMVIPAQPAPG